MAYPSFLRPAYAGKLYRAARQPIPSSAPPAAAPPIATIAGPVALPPAPLPVSYGQQSNIDQLQRQRSGLSGIYNPQREAIYGEGARSLTDNGLYDIASAQAGTVDPATGAVSYSLTGRGDGQRYRDSYNGLNAAANSRGALFGSATTWGRQDAQTALNNQRDAYLRSLAAQQAQITGQQTAAFTDLSGQIGNAQGDYADWRASQAAPIPEAAPAPTPVTTPASAYALPRAPAAVPTGWNLANQMRRRAIARARS